MKINEVVNLREFTAKGVSGTLGSIFKQAATGVMGAMGDPQSAKTYDTAMRAAGSGGHPDPELNPDAKPAAPAPAAPAPAVPTKITLPGTNLDFTKITQWVGPQGQVAGPYSSKVLDQLANGVNPADIPMSDIQRLRQEVGISEDKEKFKW